MTARELMRECPATVPAAASLLEAAVVLLQCNESALPTVDAAGRYTGMVTLSDVLRAEMPGYLQSLEDLSFLPATAGLPPAAESDLAHAPLSHEDAVGAVGPGESVLEVLRALLTRDAEACAVVESGLVLGIISRRDLVELVVCETRGGDAG